VPAGRIFPTLVAAAFGLGCLVFGAVAFLRIDGDERRTEARIQAIEAGAVASETLIVRRKYVNPGKSGLPHIVFYSETRPKIDIAATRDYFNSVNIGDAVRGYHFADGDVLLGNQPPDSGAGKWFLLGLAVLMGGSVLALARSAARMPGK